jgi:hypothetical protein
MWAFTEETKETHENQSRWQTYRLGVELATFRIEV